MLNKQLFITLAAVFFAESTSQAKSMKELFFGPSQPTNDIISREDANYYSYGKKFDKLRTELCEDVTSMKKNINTSFDEMKAEIKGLKNEAQKTKNFIKRVTLRTRLGGLAQAVTLFAAGFGTKVAFDNQEFIVNKYNNDVKPFIDEFSKKNSSKKNESSNTKESK